jgi:hypothetical protein
MPRKKNVTKKKLDFSRTPKNEDNLENSDDGSVIVEYNGNANDDDEGNVSNENEKLKKINMASKRYLNSTEIQTLITKFDNNGISVTTWLDKIEKLKTTFQWDDIETLLYAAQCLEGAPKLWYIPEFVSDWSTFKEELHDEFKRKTSPIDVHAMLMAMEKEKTETCELYAYKVRNFGKPHGLDDNSIIRYIIRGLSNEKVYYGIYNKTYDKFSDLINSIKECEAHLKIRKNPTTMKPSRYNDARKESTVPSSSNNDRKCYNCNKTGHISLHCPDPQKKPRCTKCFKVHKIGDCQVKTNVSATTHVLEKSDAEPIKSNDISLEMDQNGLIKTTLIVQPHVINAEALIDSGSAVSFLKYNNVKHLNLSFDTSNINVHGINFSKVEILGKVNALIILNSKIFKINLLIVSDQTASVDMVIGRDFFKDNNIRNFQINHNKILNNNLTNNNYDVNVMSEVISNEDSLYHTLNESSLECSLDIADSDETKACIDTVRSIFKDSYLNAKLREEPETKYDCEIRLKENKVVSVNPQRFSEYERKIVNEIVEDLLKKNIIRESDSMYSSRVVLVRKKSGDVRMCVNYRPLNKITERDHFPLPVIEDQVQKLRDKRYFSALDLKNGFYHVNLQEESKKYTAFVTQDGQYEFNRLPFGFVNSPSVFAR